MRLWRCSTAAWVTRWSMSEAFNNGRRTLRFEELATIVKSQLVLTTILDALKYRKRQFRTAGIIFPLSISVPGRFRTNTSIPLESGASEWPPS